MVEARVAPVVPTTRTLRIMAGDTVFLEDRLVVAKKRLRRGPADYVGVIARPGSADGVQLHKRCDRVRWVDRGNEVELVFTYAIAVQPGTRRGGPVRGVFELRERKGLANVIASKPVRHTVIPRPFEATTRQLAADFRGYRHYLPRARRRLEVLQRAGLRRLGLQDEDPVPSTERLNEKGMQQLWSFERERRRAWSAHRHLLAASQSSDPETARVGRAFLKNVARPASGWSKDLPPLALRDASTAAVAPAPSELSSETERGTLEPVAEFVPGSEGTIRESPPPAVPRPTEAREIEPRLPEARPETTRPVEDDRNPGFVAGLGVGLELVPTDPNDEIRLGRRFYLPAYDRGLLLDDPNIAHGGAVRASFAQVSRPEDASTLALFYFAQVGLTDDIGLEVTVPTQLVSLQAGGREQSLYRLGNPLVAGKVRVHLPLLGDRRPALTIRARWGIAATQRNDIPASDLILETFSRVPNFTDLYAFQLEKVDLGLGGSFAWRTDYVLLQAQLYFDYLFPTPIASERVSFLAISYGASVGLQPIGDIVTPYLEARAVSLVGGPSRTEMVSYLGVRSRFFEILEPALWVGLPIGSAANVSSLQFGGELRISYDLRDIVKFGGSRRDGT